MFQYEYVNVTMSGFLGAKSEGHRKIIDEYAAKGFRYVGYIPANMDSHGRYRNIDLVFEKEI